jgi:hypothetical protein
MPDLRTSIVAHLKANTTLAALVSTRVYSWTLPEAAWSGTMPCIVLNRLDVNALKTTGGARDLANTLWQIDVYGATSTSMDAAARRSTQRARRLSRRHRHGSQREGIRPALPLSRTGGRVAAPRKRAVRQPIPLHLHLRN